MLSAKEAAKVLGVSFPQFNRYKIEPDVRMPNGTRLFADATINDFYEEYIRPDKDGMTITEISKRYKVSRDNAYWWIVRKYKVPAIRTVGRKLYFRKKDIHEIAKELGWFFDW